MSKKKKRDLIPLGFSWYCDSCEEEVENVVKCPKCGKDADPVFQAYAANPFPMFEFILDESDNDAVEDALENRDFL